MGAFWRAAKLRSANVSDNEYNCLDEQATAICRRT